MHTFYRFKWKTVEDTKQVDIEVIWDNQLSVKVIPEACIDSSWTELKFHQCDHCPYSENEVLYCPLAVALSPFIALFEGTESFQNVELIVKQGERKIISKTTMQRALSSLLGLIVSVSGCPYTIFLKPMAYTHLPLATEEEAIIRSIGHFLIGQYLNNANTFNFELLKKNYKQLHLVNMGMSDRVRNASCMDAPVNALIILDTLARSVPFEIEDKLEICRSWFQP